MSSDRACPAAAAAAAASGSQPMSQDEEKNNRKRSRGDEDEDGMSDSEEDGSNPSAKRSEIDKDEIHALNTNISVLTSLDWSVPRAIREILLNCIDEDENTIVQEITTGNWLLSNAQKPRRSMLSKRSFVYSASVGKQSDRLQSGKFGYGLKDAIAILLAHGVGYEARSPAGHFRAHADSKGDVFIEIRMEPCIPQGAEQRLSRLAHCTFDDDQLRAFVEAAKYQCIALRRDISALPSFRIVDKTGTFLGTVFVPVRDDALGFNDLFVHGCAMPFSYRTPDFCSVRAVPASSLIPNERTPLTFVYNLAMDKKSIRGRDRTGLPQAWLPALTNLIKAAGPQVWDRMLRIRSTTTFYDIKNHHVASYLNSHILSEQKKIDAAQQAAQRAADELKRAESASQQLVADAAIAQQQLEAAQDEDDAPEHVVENYRVVALKSQREVARFHSRVEELQVRADQASAAFATAAAVGRGPTVIVLKHWPVTSELRPVSKVEQDSVTQLTLASAQGKQWASFPMYQEHNLMSACSLPLSEANLARFRFLRQLLYALGMEKQIRIHPSLGKPGNGSLCKLQAGILTVDFGPSVETSDVMQHAVLALSGSGLLPGLRGKTESEAAAFVGALLLRYLPEDPYALQQTARSIGIPSLLCAAPARRQFCPMLIATEWDNKKGGVSTFNMQLAKGWASELLPSNGRVYVLVIDMGNPSAQTLQVWKSAEAEGIFIRDAVLYHGALIPRMSDAERASVSHLIGHAHVTGKQARQIRTLSEFAHTKVWQINHVLPLDADLFKEKGTAREREASGRDKEALILELNESAYHVFSVGKEMAEHFGPLLPSVPIDVPVGQAPKVRTRHTELLLPLHPDFLRCNTSITKFPGLIQVLYFGRVEDVFLLKGMDIAMRACERVSQHACLVETGRKLALKIIGTKEGEEAETRKRLTENQDAKYRDFCPAIEGFASPDKVRAELQLAHIVLMPSRVEPFGLVAMEAIAAGVPVLVTHKSGVARLLTDNDLYKDHCIRTSVSRPDEKQEHAEADTVAWAKAISDLILANEKTFLRAQTVRNTLQHAIKSPYAGHVQQGNEEANQ